MCRLDNVHGEHSIDLLLFGLSCLRASTKRSRMDELDVRLLELDSVLERFNIPVLAITHASNCSSIVVNMLCNLEY